MQVRKCIEINNEVQPKINLKVCSKQLIFTHIYIDSQKATLTKSKGKLLIKKQLNVQKEEPNNSKTVIIKLYIKYKQYPNGYEHVVKIYI